MIAMKTPILTAVLGAGLLALAAGSAAAAADAPPEAASAHTRLVLSAYGEAKVVPDMATVSLGVVSEAASAAEALGQNRAQTAALFAALRKAGVQDKDIRTTGLNLQPEYTYRQNEAPLLRGYEASNQLSVVVNDLGRLGAALDAAVAAGGARVNSVNLTLRDRQTAEDEARVAAVKALQAKAKLYAQATGLRIVRLERLSEGGPAPEIGPRPVAFAGAMKSAELISPGELTVQVEVGGVYELD
jgi:uncharacterized protein YggE